MRNVFKWLLGLICDYTKVAVNGQQRQEAILFAATVSARQVLLFAALPFSLQSAPFELISSNIPGCPGHYVTLIIAFPSRPRPSACVMNFFSIFFLAVALVCASAAPSSSIQKHRYPRDLHRLYDGTWEATVPFPNSTFLKTSGFALLTAENHARAVSLSTDLVDGEILLRDGAYRTSRDLSLKLLGLYDQPSGTIVVVGDVLYEEPASALHRLYTAYTKSSNTSNLNVTEDRFVDLLLPRLQKRRKQYRAQRPLSSSSIASHCPFHATFSVTKGQFSDQPPSDADAHVYDREVPAVLSGRQIDPHDEFVEIKGSFISPTCHTKISFVLSTLDTETLFGKAINYTLLVTIVAFIQVIVLIRQMEMTSTQAGARRVSLMTVGLQAVADSYLCLGHLTMGIAVQPLFNAFATAAFFKFICFSIFLMRWMLLIWKARRPSGFSEGWEAMRRELSMLYSRFYGSLLLGILLLYQLQNHLRFFIFALYLFWLPQIILNIVEDHRRPLLPSYIIGTTITRLAIPLYFWGCPHNFLHIQPQPRSAIALVIWLFTQALILLSQYKFGPRWFIPKELLPEKYDYYRPITLEDEPEDVEAGAGECQPLVNDAQPEPLRECCICMEPVPVNSRERMVTPCNHFFHSDCLEKWLEIRLECALCRSLVPPP